MNTLISILVSAIAVSCEDPGHIANGGHGGSPPYACSSVLSYSCNQGYALLGNNTLVCRGDGQWSAPKPKCELIRKYYVTNC